MADNAKFYSVGTRQLYTNTGSAITAGDVVPLASGTSGTIGIAINDIAATTGTGEVEKVGVFLLPKATGEAMTIDQLVYWDDTNNYVTGTSTSTFYRAGRVFAAAASAATTVYVKINVP